MTNETREKPKKRLDEFRDAVLESYDEARESQEGKVQVPESPAQATMRCRKDKRS